MKFSKKSRYGLRALICLALSGENERVALSTIAEKGGISLQYLEQVFAALRRAGIIRSVKGAQGGYILNDNPSKITVSRIIEALDGTYSVENEVTDGNHDAPSEAIQKLVIDKVNEQTRSLLESVTLADLVEDCKNRSVQEYMYFI